MRRLLPLALAGTWGCAAAFAPARPPWPPFPNGQFMHVGEFLQVSGVGQPKKATLTQTQARSEARDAAILDAWTRLKGYIGSLPLPDGSHVSDAEQADPALAKSVETLVYSATIVSTQWADPQAAVVVRLRKSSINRLLGTDFK
ncbi:MAG: hypothetical protein KGL53_00385 [Elusimicrobia bacterium]|nr:hypothetical protein [Elusimicrobiota bacterium]